MFICLARLCRHLQKYFQSRHSIYHLEILTIGPFFQPAIFVNIHRNMSRNRSVHILTHKHLSRVGAFLVSGTALNIHSCSSPTNTYHVWGSFWWLGQPHRKHPSTPQGVESDLNRKKSREVGTSHRLATASCWKMRQQSGSWNGGDCGCSGFYIEMLCILSLERNSGLSTRKAY